MPELGRWVLAITSPDGYPRVGDRQELLDAGLESGDQLLAIGDRDLRGVGPIGLFALALANAEPELLIRLK